MTNVHRRQQRGDATRSNACPSFCDNHRPEGPRSQRRKSARSELSGSAREAVSEMMEGSDTVAVQCKRLDVWGAGQSMVELERD